MEVCLSFKPIFGGFIQLLHIVHVMKYSVCISNSFVGFIPKVPQAIGSVKILMRSIVAGRCKHIRYIGEHITLVGSSGDHQLRKDIFCSEGEHFIVVGCPVQFEVTVADSECCLYALPCTKGGIPFVKRSCVWT